MSRAASVAGQPWTTRSRFRGWRERHRRSHDGHTDKTIKTILDANDIHKRRLGLPVVEGLDLTDKFLLFKGRSIASDLGRRRSQRHIHDHVIDRERRSGLLDRGRKLSRASVFSDRKAWPLAWHNH